MEPSRDDIPALAVGVNSIETKELAKAIELYRGELSEAMKNSDRTKMIRAGQVLVLLLAKQNQIFSSRLERAFLHLD